ncbi:Hypothetical predicted protein [Lecanosticta acicola]|uniref:DNA ligase D 3'-phosphoesterase domain-containing protein n=1 Tax=Lecanosticta acicola TaxID=111012 RepID=A0AAI8W130_9PEZI|nr:Hypothetical predicted protein [Lecanosticta acicola]
MTRPDTLAREISPPPLRKNSTAIDSRHLPEEHSRTGSGDPSLAAVEAGEVNIRDHLDYFVNHLSAASRPTNGPRISFDDFGDLYKRNQHARGHHFVVHQHDHPISGTARPSLKSLSRKLMQFSETSSISFAVPYGLPGNPNSIRPNRMAIETRVHNLWNHLIESASHATGSLLIWDIGEYEVMSRQQKREEMTDDELSDVDIDQEQSTISESGKLFKAFQSRHIRLRLHGTKLPQDYTIALRLPSANNRAAQPERPSRKRRRVDPTKAAKRSASLINSDSEEAEDVSTSIGETEYAGTEGGDLATGIASEDEEDATIRANNAYPGSSNTIGSIHQRHWFLTLDRAYSGFHKVRAGSDAGCWVGNWEAFYVQGRDHERSVVTGRTADDIMADEAVEKFVGRKMWRPITE